MNYYNIGIELALEKLATSRWREAIRSGEISPEAGDVIKERMGFDPRRHAEGLMRGARQRAASHGYKFYEHTPKAYLGELKRLAGAAGRGFREKGLAGAGAAVKQWAPGAGERALGLVTGVLGGGGGANPMLERIDLVPGMRATRGGTMPIVAPHEASEASEMKRFSRPMEKWYRQIPEKKVKSLSRTIGSGAAIGGELGHWFNDPDVASDIRYVTRELLQKGLDPALLNPNMPEDLVRQIVPGVHTSQHASAMPPIQDIREGRLLGGRGQRAIEALRAGSGELGMMGQAAERATGMYNTTPGGYLPRGRARAVAKEMERLNLARGARIAEGEAGPIASRVARGLARLRKLLGR